MYVLGIREDSLLHTCTVMQDYVHRKIHIPYGLTIVRVKEVDHARTGEPRRQKRYS